MIEKIKWRGVAGEKSPSHQTGKCHLKYKLLPLCRGFLTLGEDVETEIVTL